MRTVRQLGHNHVDEEAGLREQEPLMIADSVLGYGTSFDGSVSKFMSSPNMFEVVGILRNT